MNWEIREGDSLALLRDMPDASVDAIITDPPYSSGGQFRGDRVQETSTKYVMTGTKLSRPEFAGDNRDQRSFAYWCALWLGECLRVAKPGAPICVFSDWRQLPSTTDSLQAGGWVWRGVVVWDKTEGVRPTMGRFTNQAEYIVWGSNGAMPVERGVGCLPGVLKYYPRDKHHITGKPVELMRPLCRICAPKGVILDPFAGSGSTGVAAIAEGFQFIGFERVEAYAEIARKRIAESREQLALFNADAVPDAEPGA